MELLGTIVKSPELAGATAGLLAKTELLRTTVKGSELVGSTARVLLELRLLSTTVKSTGLVGAVTAVLLEPGLMGEVVGGLKVVGCVVGLPPAAEDIISTLVGDTDSVDVDSVARVVLRNSRPLALRGAASRR